MHGQWQVRSQLRRRPPAHLVGVVEVTSPQCEPGDDQEGPEGEEADIPPPWVSGCSRSATGCRPVQQRRAHRHCGRGSATPQGRPVRRRRTRVGARVARQCALPAFRRRHPDRDPRNARRSRRGETARGAHPWLNNSTLGVVVGPTIRSLLHVAGDNARATTVRPATAQQGLRSFGKRRTPGDDAVGRDHPRPVQIPGGRVLCAGRGRCPESTARPWSRCRSASQPTPCRRYARREIEPSLAVGLPIGMSGVLVRSIGVGAAGCGRRTLRSNSTGGVNGITSRPFGPHRLQAAR
jgi:hypothetical protein